MTEEDIKIIMVICEKLGWTIAIPGEDDHDLHGLIIGEQSYIDYILKHVD